MPISIFETIGRNLGDVVAKGTPTGGTGTTLDSNTLVHPLTDQLKGNELYIWTGQGAGQARTITAFAPANNRITVDPAFTTIPTANSEFLIFKHFRIDDYENALNRAIGQTRLINLIEKVATLNLAGSQYEYVVPSGFEYIRALRLVPSGSTDYGADDEVSRIFELRTDKWRIEPNALGTFVIAFDSRKIDLDFYDKEWVNIVGQAKPDLSATLIPENLQEFLIAGASMLLSSQRISEGQEWRIKFGAFKQIRDELEPYVFKHRHGKRVS